MCLPLLRFWSSSTFDWKMFIFSHVPFHFCSLKTLFGTSKVPQNCIFLLFFVWLQYKKFPQKLFSCPLTTIVKRFLINIAKYAVFFLMKFCSPFEILEKSFFSTLSSLNVNYQKQSIYHTYPATFEK